MMTDWSSGVETRNYRIPRSTDARNLVDLLASALCFLMIATSLFGFLWIRSRIVSLGYALQQVKATEESLQRVQNNLVTQEETLTRPDLIDFIARNDLAMEPLGPYQRMAPRFREILADRPAGLVMLDVGQAGIQPGRRSANNAN